MSDTNFSLFISYAEAERAWAEGYLRNALEGAGIQCRSEETFRLGVPRIQEFERAVQECQRVLLVLSPAYLAEDVSQFTDLLAQSYGLETETWPVIPLLFQAVELPPRLGILQALDATDPATWPQAVERLCTEMKQPLPGPLPKPPCPYPGMRPFAKEDSARFFGREREVQALLQELRLYPFLAVIGPSGSGKSSLVFAGLIPSLTGSNLFGSGDWLVRSLRPATAPLAALAVALAAPAATPADSALAVGEILNSLTPAPGSAPASLAPAITALLASQPGAKRLMLVIDQFEEVFQGSEVTPFQEALRRLTQMPNCFVVITVRADFYPELMTTPLWADIQAHRAEVVPLDADGLRQAIVRPAEDVGVFVETALVEQLVADAAGEPGILPFVQETLVLLWDKVERRYLPLRAYEALIMTARSYRQMGDTHLTGLQVAMAAQAEAAFQALTPEQQAIARRIFLRLVQFGEGRRDTRRQQPAQALCAKRDNPELFSQTLAALADHRLLTLVGEEDSPARLVDIAHEALIGGWPTLQGWVRERRDAERTRRRLEDKAAEWERLNRAGGLLDELELLEADRWLHSPDAEELGTSEALPALIDASRSAIDRAAEEKEAARQRELTQARELADAERRRAEEQAKGRKRLLWLAAALAVFFVLALIAAGLAAAMKSRADDSAAAAETSAAIARAGATGQAVAANALATDVVARETAQALAEANEKRAVQGEAAAVALQIKADRQARVALSQEIAASAQNRLYAGDSEQALLLAIAATELVTETTESTNLLRDAIEAWRGKQVLTGHRGRVSGAVYSANGQYLATTGVDGTVRLWQMIGKQRVLVIHAHEKEITDFAFSHDSRLIFSAGRDNVAHVWDVETGKLLHTMDHGAQIVSLDPSADDKLLATGGEDGRVWVWDVDTGRPVPTAPFQAGGAIHDVAFSPDGKAVVAGSADASVWIWDIASGQSAQLGGYNAAVDGILFSGNGKYMATRSGSRLLVWDLSGTEILKLKLNGTEHAAKINGMGFSFDSRFLATACEDGLAWLWDLDRPKAAPRALAGHGGPVWGIVFSGNDRFLATTSWDKTARLWRVADRQTEAVLWGANADLWNGTFSPDSTTLATPASDGRVWLWSTQMGGDLAAHSSRSLPPLALQMAGSQAVIAGEDGQVEVWDPATGKATQFRAGESRLTSLAASRDAGLWAAGSIDGQIYLMNIKTGKVAATLKADGQAVQAMAFLPDGVHLATASSGSRGTIQVWDLVGRQVAQTLTGHQDDVSALALGEGGVLLSAGADGTVRFWDWQAGQQEKMLDASEALVAMAASPDGKTIAASGRSSAVYQWNLASAKASPDRLGHSSTVRSLAYSGDGRWLASGDEDGTIHLWDVATHKGTEFEAHRASWVTGLGFTPDSEQLVSIGTDSRAHAWPVHTADLVALACSRVTRTLTIAEWLEFLPTMPMAAPCPPPAAAGQWLESNSLEAPLPQPPTASQTDSGLPTILYFEAVPSTSPHAGETVTLRWAVSGANAAYLEHDGQSNGVTSPDSVKVAAEDASYRLRAVNDAGERVIEIKIVVQPPPAQLVDLPTAQ